MGTKRFIHISDLHLGYSAWKNNEEKKYLRNLSDEMKEKALRTYQKD